MNSLETYKKLITSGLSPEQAEAHIKVLEETELLNKKDIEHKLDQRFDALEKHLKIFFVYLIGGAVVGGVALPIYLKIIGVI